MKYNTLILETSEKNTDVLVIKQAADIINAGGIVVFPTDTVYGIGANALDTDAVDKIFAAKGRPSDNPLIVHLSNMQMLELVSKELPLHFMRLAEKFWPGPLTMIVKKNPDIPARVTAGLDTVALRIPGSNIARMLISYANTPIGAPSANISGRPSATLFEHVYEDFYGRVDAIIKGNDLCAGLESTVIDLTSSEPEILRPGHVTALEISEYLGVPVKTVCQEISDNQPRSPGMKYKHYAPKAELILYAGKKEKVRENILSHAKEFYSDQKVGILSFEPYEAYSSYYNICLSKNGSIKEASGNLFAALREFDKAQVDVILSETVDNTGLGEAVMNRLFKAGNNKITYV